MILKALFIVLIFLAASGCSTAKQPQAPYAQRLGQIQERLPEGISDIGIISSRTIMKRGEVGNIAIQGQPGTAYTIDTSYFKDGKQVTYSNKKTSDANGIVYWSWVAGNETEPGTYPISISGGGKTLISSYTVQ